MRTRRRLEERSRAQRAAPRRRSVAAQGVRGTARRSTSAAASGRLLERLLRRSAVRRDRRPSTSRSARSRSRASGSSSTSRMPPSSASDFGCCTARSSTATRGSTASTPAPLVEVIEHLDPRVSRPFAAHVFASARPRIVVITTPNGNTTKSSTASCRGRPPPRPPLRVDERASSPLGREPSRSRFGYPCASAGGPRIPASARRRRWQCSNVESSFPDPSLVVLDSGRAARARASFAARRFRPTKVSSPPTSVAGLVSDDENEPGGRPRARSRCFASSPERRASTGRTADHRRRHERAARGTRRPLVALAREREHCTGRRSCSRTPPELICLERDRDPARPRLRRARRQAQALTAASLAEEACSEGFRRVSVLARRRSVEAARSSAAAVDEQRGERGQFDIAVGDVHGCTSELVGLLGRLGYTLGADGVTVTPRRGATQYSS